MAALSAKPTPNGPSKTTAAGGANGADEHDDHGDSAALDFGISEPVSSTSTPPVPTTTAPSTKKGAGKVGKKPLDPSEVNNLLHQKISQLETDKDAEEEEERAISRAVRLAHKELSDLVASREDHAAKIDTLQTKCSDLLFQMKRVERDHAKAKKRADQLQKEKDQSRSEMQKAMSMKHKLETLCRELQKENKRIKDESKRLARDEQVKREELSEKFESTIWEIKNRMIEEDDQHNTSSGAGSRKSNIEADELFKAKFKSFVEQYEMRELHFQSLLKMKELEVQFNLARYEQQRKNAETEAARAKALHQQVSTFTQTEAELRSQLNIYVEKFKQVEDTLNNSNDLFLTFRKEMEDMSKKTKRLEKENAALSRKSETTNRNLLEMAEERTRHHKELETLKKKNAKLESICRALQKERNALETRIRNGEGDEEELMDDDGEEDDEDDDGEDEEGSEEYSGEEGSEEYDDEEDLEDDSEDEIPPLEEVPDEVNGRMLHEELMRKASLESHPQQQQQQQKQQVPVRNGHA